MKIKPMLTLFATALAAFGVAAVQAEVPNSYAPVADSESFETVKQRLEKEKPKVEADFKAASQYPL